MLFVLSGNDESRIYEAAALYKREISYNIILSKTSQTFGDYDLPYTDIQLDMLRQLDIPEGAVYVSEIEAKNTGQEASGIVNRMYDLGFRSVIVITDAWHTRRVKTIFSDTFSNTPFTLQIHPASNSGYSRHFWWLTPSGWRITVSEYIRILGYLIKRDSNIPDYPNF